MNTIKGKCDLCSKPDGYGGHNLQKCKDCGLLVHELCYATVPTDSKNPNWICHACKAVGTEVEVNVPSNVKTGIHAMHPLYDMPGAEGRQLVLPATGVGFKKTEKRLAWVHSLCAQFICSNDGTRGCVYGTYDGGKWEIASDDDSDHVQKYEKGTKVSKMFDAGLFSGEILEYHPTEKLYTVVYEDGDREDLEEDEVEEMLVSRKQSRCSNETLNTDNQSKDDEGLAATEWFVISNDSKHSKIIAESRELKCTICNSIDKRSFRIPVQCSAWNKSEFSEFKKCHKKDKYEKKKPVCYLAMHVGCARWATSNYAGVKGKSLRMCYYYPGKEAGFVVKRLTRIQSAIYFAEFMPVRSWNT
ncbi:hypothetical protein HJC23_012673 [Cyclotella cryptica]|uniref:PTM/DIR17-like Tudor domain-containing protein n=1 Tax=Cyclotella cryptica TaxID=29204 RepID=A0ABD3QLI5_9STRA